MKPMATAPDTWSSVSDNPVPVAEMSIHGYAACVAAEVSFE